MLLESVRLLTIVSVALCLVPAGAHLFELANKMALSPAEYMTVQKIYAGWAFFGIAIGAALPHRASLPRCHAGDLLAVHLSDERGEQQLDDNAGKLREARRQWEYSNAVNAVLTFVAFVVITLAVLKSRMMQAPE
jgi:hypothetical protein